MNKDEESKDGKISKRDKLKLVWIIGVHGKTLEVVPMSDNRDDIMKTIYENGEHKH